MYADDLILLSITLYDLQCMLNICSKEFDDTGMTINSQKTSCMRIGTQHAAIVNMPVSNSRPISWKQELSYLGVVILGGNFQIN